MVGRELIGQIADDAELGLLRAVLHVVVADRFELAAIGDAVKSPLLLDELLLVVVRHAGDDTELAESIAEDRTPVLAGLRRQRGPASTRWSSARPKSVI